MAGREIAFYGPNENHGTYVSSMRNSDEKILVKTVNLQLDY
jgi:hypothetical protein